MSCLEQNEFAMIVVKGKFLPKEQKEIVSRIQQGRSKGRL